MLVMAFIVGSSTAVTSGRKAQLTKLNPGVYNDSNRPSHSAGKLIYNSSIGNIQVSNGSAWV